MHLPGNFHFLTGAAFGFQLLRCGPPLCFGGLGHFVEADQCEGIAIDVFEAGEYSSPNRRLFSQEQRRSISCPVRRALFILDAPQFRNMTESDSTPAPLGVCRDDIFGHKRNLRRFSDELVLFRLGIRRNQGKHRRTMRRRNPHPALSRLQAHIKGQTESKLFNIKLQTPVLIADKNVDRVHPKMGVFTIQR